MAKHGSYSAFAEPPGSGYTSNEDYLFLNVYTPIKAKNLPLLIWIRKTPRC